MDTSPLAPKPTSTAKRSNSALAASTMMLATKQCRFCPPLIASDSRPTAIAGKNRQTVFSRCWSRQIKASAARCRYCTICSASLVAQRITRLFEVRVGSPPKVILSKACRRAAAFLVMVVSCLEIGQPQPPRRLKGQTVRPPSGPAKKTFIRVTVDAGWPATRRGLRAAGRLSGLVTCANRWRKSSHMRGWLESTAKRVGRPPIEPTASPAALDRARG